MMERVDEGLRCQDVHAGLRNVDANSAPVAQHLDRTQVVGMAATLAAAIRGEDVIGDAQALKVIASDQLDINPFAFPDVIRLLDERGFVRSVVTDANGIVSFSENVPFHQNLYEAMGDAWEDSKPDDVAVGVVRTVHELAKSPLERSEFASKLGLSEGDASSVLSIGEASELVKRYATPDGEIIYSPFHAFENPEQLVTVFAEYGSDRVQEELAQLQGYQGLPVSNATPVLTAAVDRGLLAAPSIKKPDGEHQAFAFLPYSIDPSYLMLKKSILEKAIAILACVRCGQHFGGATNIKNPHLILAKLGRGESLRPHSSATRQYEVLYRMRVVDYTMSGERAWVRLIDTSDNTEALALAVELLRYGQKMEDRVGEGAARDLLSQNGVYRAPLQTIRDRRGKVGLPDHELRSIFEALMMGRD